MCQGGDSERAGGGDIRTAEETQKEHLGAAERSSFLLLCGQLGSLEEVCLNDSGRGRAGGLYKCRGGVQPQDGQGGCHTLTDVLCY